MCEDCELLAKEMEQLRQQLAEANTRLTLLGEDVSYETRDEERDVLFRARNALAKMEVPP